MVPTTTQLPVFDWDFDLKLKQYISMCGHAFTISDDESTGINRIGGRELGQTKEGSPRGRVDAPTARNVAENAGIGRHTKATRSRKSPCEMVTSGCQGNDPRSESALVCFSTEESPADSHCVSGVTSLYL